MKEDLYTDFPKFYSTDKKKIDNLLTSVSMYCCTFSYITVRDYIDLYRKLSPGVEVKDGSIFWCIEYEDLRGNMRVKKDKTKGWYLEMPAAYLF
nr:MAG TPA: hypothetical protein [Caudoviricetes sp.]